MLGRSTLLVTCAVVLQPWAALAGAQDQASFSPDPLPAPQRSEVELPDSPPDQTGWGVAAGLRYLEIIRGGAKPTDKLPLLIVIHGLGDKPAHDWLRAIDVDPGIKVRMILPQAPLPHSSGFSWFPFRAATLDQPALARSVAEAADRVARMISALQKLRPTRGRAVVTGFSQGGMLSYALAFSHPELIELSVPISGMVPVPNWPEHARKAAWFPKVRALHGTADGVIRYDVDRQFVDRAHELGYPVELVPFEATEHTISPPMSALVRSTLSEVFATKPPRGKSAKQH